MNRFLLKLLLPLLTLIASTGPLQSQAPADSRKKLVLLISGQSYETERTLPAFAERFLSDEFRVVVVSGAMSNPENRFIGIEELADADLLLVSVWRRTPPAEQLRVIRRYVESGRPVVGIATASHAFARRKTAALPPGSADWPEWDALVIGGHYTGHYPSGLITEVSAADPEHPILSGVQLPFRSKMELNRVSPVNPKAQVLLRGALEGHPPEPVAWTFTHYGQGKTFFTPLGHPDDFTQPPFQQLLLNAIRWAVRPE